MWRAVLILLVAAGLAPGLYLRSTPSPRSNSMHFEAAQIAIPPAKRRLAEADGAPILEQAWALSSENSSFAGFSALLARGGGEFFLLSDHAVSLRLALDADGPRMRDLKPLWRRTGAGRFFFDSESLTDDPASGRIWIGIEGRNAIMRLERGFRDPVEAAPPEMADWPYNNGPEAMVRLADGRFLVLAEGSLFGLGADSPGLLFTGDPVEGAAVTPFLFRPPEGYLPTDMARLPDGRVLILLRAVKFGLPPRFTARILLADPAAITAGESWPWQEVAFLEDPALPLDNFEGLAVSPGSGGALDLWLVSDDNKAAYQRTLLLRISWTPPAR